VQDYIPGGIEAAAELEAVLAAFDRKFSDFDAIYDFGAGRSCAAARSRQGQAWCRLRWERRRRPGHRMGPGEPGVDQVEGFQLPAAGA
jgi:hypothetical protein